METTTNQFLHFKNGVPQKLLSEAEVKTLLGIASTPAEVVTDAPKPFGHPRMLIGTRGPNRIYTGTGIDYLLEVYGDNPDQFAPKGANLAFTLNAGAIKPKGAGSDWSGNAAPASFVRPAGYRKRYFTNDKAPYYEQSSLPDEVLPSNTVSAPIDLSTLNDTGDYGLLRKEVD